MVDLEGGWAGLGTSLAKEVEEECRNRPRVCYAFLRRGGAPTGPGCRVPGAMGGGGDGAGAVTSSMSGGGGGGAGAARAAVNLALGLHGLTESFSLSFVLDEEACNKEVPHIRLVEASLLTSPDAVVNFARTQRLVVVAVRVRVRAELLVWCLHFFEDTSARSGGQEDQEVDSIELVVDDVVDRACLPSSPHPGFAGVHAYVVVWYIVVRFAVFIRLPEQT